MKFVAAIMFCAGLFAGVGSAASAAQAKATSSWNGEWVGNWANNGNGIQIIFVDNDVNGVFWNGDYIPEVHSSVSQGGAVVTITWPSSTAVITRDSETAGHIVVHEKGRPDSTFPIARDNQ
jgi:hypothetical protein